MDDRDRLSTEFEASRPRLRALAYRMLGSHEEADDTVQETWLRVRRADAAAVDNLGGWLTTIVARICLDRLRARSSRPEDPAGMSPPEPAAASTGPEDEAVIADSIGSALLVVLDLLSPGERVAFVLHDVFAVPFDEIGTIVGRTTDAARQLASRARRRVRGASAAGGVDLVRRREVVEAFLRAARDGDFQALLTVLDPDVVLRPDEATVRMGNVPEEARGANAVADFMQRGGRALRLALVDGVAGLAWMPAARILGAVELTIVGDRIVEIELTRGPEHLDRLDVVLLED